MLVSVKVEGERKMVFGNVKVRVRKDYKLCLHLDTDEGNAAGIARKGEGIIINGK
jgi:propanediol utilization protein